MASGDITDTKTGIKWKIHCYQKLSELEKDGYLMESEIAAGT